MGGPIDTKFAHDTGHYDVWDSHGNSTEDRKSSSAEFVHVEDYRDAADKLTDIDHSG